VAPVVGAGWMNAWFAKDIQRHIRVAIRDSDGHHVPRSAQYVLGDCSQIP
jgi:hypothetical protein